MQGLGEWKKGMLCFCTRTCLFWILRFILFRILGIPVLDFGSFGVQGSGFSGSGSGLRVWGWEFSVQGLYLRF